jgi:hypothetical protein
MLSLFLFDGLTLFYRLNGHKKNGLPIKKERIGGSKEEDRNYKLPKKRLW